MASTFPDGEVGELWARSPAGMMGYYRNPEATRQTLRDGGRIATGELARILPDGDIAIVGWVKEMIIRSGFDAVIATIFGSKILRVTITKLLNET